jgi:hypothetical protein
MGRPLPEALLVDPSHNPNTPPPAAWALPESAAGGADPSTGDPTTVDRGAELDPTSIDPRRDPGPDRARDASAGDDRAWHEPVSAGGPPARPVPLKPMTTSDILDGAWAITKARPRTVLALTAVIILPPQVLSAWLLRDVPQNLDVLFALNNPDALSGRQTGAQLGLFVARYVAAAIVVLSYYALGVALGRLVSAWYAGGDLSIKQVLAVTGRKSPVILATFLLLLVPIVLSTAACYVGAFFIVPLFMLAGPIIGIEDAGPVQAAKRSWSLVSRRLFWCMWYWFAALLIETLVNTAIQLAPDIVGLVSEGAARFLGPVASVVAHCITAPFVVGVSVLVYLDLRVRTEGLDLELDAGDVFARAA